MGAFPTWNLRQLTEDSVERSIRPRNRSILFFLAYELLINKLRLIFWHGTISIERNDLGVIMVVWTLISAGKWVDLPMKYKWMVVVRPSLHRGRHDMGAVCVVDKFIASEVSVVFFCNFSLFPRPENTFISEQIPQINISNQHCHWDNKAQLNNHLMYFTYMESVQPPTTFTRYIRLSVIL